MPSHRSLFLDTASAHHLLALVDDEGVTCHPLPSHGDAALVATLEDALQKRGWGYEDLTRIACVTGPGGFASLRTGITAANALAYALGIPIAGLHLSEIWKARVPGFAGAQHDASFLWLHSTRKNTLFVRGFGGCAQEFPEAILIELGGERVFSPQGEYVGELLEEHKRALPECIPLAETHIAPLMEVLPALLKTLDYKKEVLLPWYGREP